MTDLMPGDIIVEKINDDIILIVVMKTVRDDNAEFDPVLIEDAYHIVNNGQGIEIFLRPEMINTTVVIDRAVPLQRGPSIVEVISSFDEDDYNYLESFFEQRDSKDETVETYSGE